MVAISHAAMRERASGLAARNATRLAFFIAGFAVSAWAPLVPYAKARAGLGDGGLGLLLFGLGIGSIVAMPLAGALTARLGCRRVMVAGTAILCLSLPLLALLTTWGGLMAALLAFGAGLGVLDCAMNIQAIVVERAARRPMMSGFHGLFSLGCIAGAGGVASLLALGITPLVGASGVVAGLLVLLALAAPHWLPRGGGQGGPLFAVPHGIVLFLGMLCFIAFLTEGAALDWSAVFLSGVKQVEPARAGFAYAAFATTMTIGRLSGDHIVKRVGGPRIVAIGGLLAAAGLAVVVLVPGWVAGLAGFALVGAGCANIVPVYFSAIGRQKVMPETLAVPAMATMGYAGVLAGPAAIGGVAHLAGLPTAFLVIAGLLVGVAGGSRFLPR